MTLLCIYFMHLFFFLTYSLVVAASSIPVFRVKGISEGSGIDHFSGIAGIQAHIIHAETFELQLILMLEFSSASFWVTVF